MLLNLPYQDTKSLWDVADHGILQTAPTNYSQSTQPTISSLAVSCYSSGYQRPRYYNSYSPIPVVVSRTLETCKYMAGILVQILRVHISLFFLDV